MNTCPGKKRPAAVVRAIRKRTRAAGITTPSPNTVRARVSAVTRFPPAVHQQVCSWRQARVAT